MKKINHLYILVFLLIILFSSSAIAFSGISPAKINKNFIPNIEEDLQFKAYGYKEPSVEVTCKEILFPKNIVQKEDYHEVFLTLKLPAEMEEPGEKLCGVNIHEKSEEVDYQGLGTKTSVGGLVVINVPYPGLYAQLKLTARNVNRDEIEIFHVYVKNLGEEKLNDIKVNINIYDAADKLVGMVSTDRVSIEKFLSRETDVIWDTKGIEPGRHTAIATLEYDGDMPIEDEAEFLIGKIFVEFKGASENGTAFQINPFEINIESWWGNKIGNVFADVKMKNASGAEAGSFKTISVDLKPWQKSTIEGHWDALGLDAGNYTANIRINYEDKTTNATWPYELISLPKEVSDSSKLLESIKIVVLNPIFLITIIILIVVIDILWMRRNKKRKKNEKK